MVLNNHSAPLTFRDYYSAPLTVHDYHIAPLTVHDYYSAPLTFRDYYSASLTVHDYYSAPFYSLDLRALGRPLPYDSRSLEGRQGCAVIRNRNKYFSSKWNR
jgi:hypothetical protein